MWTYKQNTGELVDGDGVIVGTGYSGHGIGLNNPFLEALHDTGPIPSGKWIVGKFFDDAHPGKGPAVCHLTPLAGTNTYGRDGFMIHGDNIIGDNSASHGCIILPHAIRLALKNSSDRELLVIE